MKLRLMICAMAASTALFATDVTSYTYGVLAVTNATATTAVGVPWRQVDESATATDISLSNLVSTTGLATGDIIYLYEGTTWYGYQLSSTGVWEPYTTVSGKTTVSAPGSADAKYLARGTGLIVQRASATNPIYLCGRYDSSTPSATSVDAGAMVLIANPTTTTKTFGASDGAVGDQIRVPLDGGGLKIYEKKSDGWGSMVETTEQQTRRGKQVTVTTQTWTPGCTLAPGMGAWYVSKDAAATIAW